MGLGVPAPVSCFVRYGSLELELARVMVIRIVRSNS